MTNVIRRHTHTHTHGEDNPNPTDTTDFDFTDTSARKRDSSPTIHFRCAVDTLLDAIPTLGEFPYPSRYTTSPISHTSHTAFTRSHQPSQPSQPSQPDHPFQPDLPDHPTWSGPTQFISGSNSSYIRPDNVSSTRVFFTNSSLKVIQGAGHWVLAD